MAKTLLLAFLFFTFRVFGTQYESQDCFFNIENCSSRKWLVDANIGYFYPFSKSLREVISGGVDYQLQLTYKLTRRVGLFVEGDCFYKSGHSTGSKSKTSIWIVPLTFGVRAWGNLWQSDDQTRALQGYCLVGPRWYIVHASNSARFVGHHNHSYGFGGVGGVGIAYLLNCFSVNIFCNGSFGNVQAHSSRHHVRTPKTQVGGIVAGAGLGWNF